MRKRGVRRVACVIIFGLGNQPFQKFQGIVSAFLSVQLISVSRVYRLRRAEYGSIAVERGDQGIRHALVIVIELGLFLAVVIGGDRGQQTAHIFLNGAAPHHGRHVEGNDLIAKLEKLVKRRGQAVVVLRLKLSVGPRRTDIGNRFDKPSVLCKIEIFFLEQLYIVNQAVKRRSSGKAVIFIVFVVEIIVFEVAADLILRFDIGLRGVRLPRYEIIIERLIINVADIREQSLFRQIIGAGRGADKHLLLQIRDRIRHRIGISGRSNDYLHPRFSRLKRVLRIFFLKALRQGIHAVRAESAVIYPDVKLGFRLVYPPFSVAAARKSQG